MVCSTLLITKKRKLIVHVCQWTERLGCYTKLSGILVYLRCKRPNGFPQKGTGREDKSKNVIMSFLKYLKYGFQNAVVRNVKEFWGCKTLIGRFFDGRHSNVYQFIGLTSLITSVKNGVTNVASDIIQDNPVIAITVGVALGLGLLAYGLYKWNKGSSSEEASDDSSEASEDNEASEKGDGKDDKASEESSDALVDIVGDSIIPGLSAVRLLGHMSAEEIKVPRGLSTVLGANDIDNLSQWATNAGNSLAMDAVSSLKSSSLETLAIYSLLINDLRGHFDSNGIYWLDIKDYEALLYSVTLHRVLYEASEFYKEGEAVWSVRIETLLDGIIKAWHSGKPNKEWVITMLYREIRDALIYLARRQPDVEKAIAEETDEEKRNILVTGRTYRFDVFERVSTKVTKAGSGCLSGGAFTLSGGAFTDAHVGALMNVLETELQYLREQYPNDIIDLGIKILGYAKSYLQECIDNKVVIIETFSSPEDLVYRDFKASKLDIVYYEKRIVDAFDAYDEGTAYPLVKAILDLDYINLHMYKRRKYIEIFGVIQKGLWREIQKIYYLGVLEASHKRCLEILCSHKILEEGPNGVVYKNDTRREKARRTKQRKNKKIFLRDQHPRLPRYQKKYS
jgi:hypothetical protein